MTDRSHRHAETVKTIRQSLRQEIQWREQLIEQYLCSSDPTMDDILEVYTHLTRKNNGDVHLEPGGDSWATVRSRDILKAFDVWDDETRSPKYQDVSHIPLSEFAYMTLEGLDTEYVESLVEEGAVPDATVSCDGSVAYISKEVDSTTFTVTINFGDLGGRSAYNAVMSKTRTLEMEIEMAQCDHDAVPDPGLDGTISEGDLLACENCTYTERVGEPKSHDRPTRSPEVSRSE